MKLKLKLAFDDYGMVLPARRTKKGKRNVGTVRYTNEEIRKRKGYLNHAKIKAASEEQIAAWKREDSYDNLVIGHVRAVPALIDVRALRERLCLSQEEFATRYMLSLRTVQEWEQYRREPSEAARVLLHVIAQDPTAIARMLQHQGIGEYLARQEREKGPIPAENVPRCRMNSRYKS